MRLPLLFSLVISASASDLPPAGDTYVVAQSGTNFGTQASLNIGPGTQALLQFDLTVLPQGVTAAQVARANLRLYVNRLTTPGQMDIALAGSPWTEANTNGLNAPAVGKAINSGVGVSAAGSYLTLEATNAVRAWLDGSSPNLGFVLSANASRPATASFDSKENTITSHPAQLEIALVGPQGPAGPTGPQGPEARVTVANVCAALSYADSDSCLRAISEVKLVFQTANLYTGSLGGLSGADDKCQSEARAAGLAGTFKAWLSDSSGSPSTRFTKSGHYRLADASRTLLAVSYEELTSSGLRVPILVSANGDEQGGGDVWTGTTPSGGPATENCSNWTAGTFSGSNGATGLSAPIPFGLPKSLWTASGSRPCGDIRHFFCFQQ